MAHMSFTNSSFTHTQQHRLLDLAQQSIFVGLSGERTEVDLSEYEEPLILPGASFVTLHINKSLRGCIGHLEPIQPLVQDVAENAWSAAFRDPRFPALSVEEMSQLDIHISVLTKPEPIRFYSEQDLLQQLVPFEDGLILATQSQRGTFLPSVWESLPEPKEFLAQLKRKAGLPVHYWSDDISIHRYQTIAIHR